MNENLNKAFDALNKCLFQNKLKPVKFLINPSERHVLHLRLPDVIEVGGGFADPSVAVIDVLDTLVHIMVHLDNYRQGIVDFTNNQYHRREFCEKALDIGFIVAWHKTRGWSVTHSDPNLKILGSYKKIRHPDPKKAQKLKSAYDLVAPFCSAIHDLRGKIRRDLKHKPQKVFQLKYVCGCVPPVIVRSGRRPDGPKPLNVSCNVCGAKFVIAEPVD